MIKPVTQPKQTRKKFDKVFKQHAVELGSIPNAAPNNSKPKTPLSGERMTICVNNAIF
jgi:hypothetical protein